MGCIESALGALPGREISQAVSDIVGSSGFKPVVFGRAELVLKR